MSGAAVDDEPTAADSQFRLTVPDSVGRQLTPALEGIDRAGWTLSFAESCTSGLAAAAVSNVPELGHVLDCAFVTYSDDAKKRLLGIPEDVLEREGAVSEPVARLMAGAALERSGAHAAIAITGFAGPAGPDDEEGRVHFAVALSTGVVRHREEHFGPLGQDAIRLAALEVVVELIGEISLQARACV